MYYVLTVQHVQKYVFTMKFKAYNHLQHDFKYWLFIFHIGHLKEKICHGKMEQNITNICCIG